MGGAKSGVSLRWKIRRGRVRRMKGGVGGTGEFGLGGALGYLDQTQGA